MEIQYHLFKPQVRFKCRLDYVEWASHSQKIINASNVTKIASYSMLQPIQLNARYALFKPNVMEATISPRLQDIGDKIMRLQYFSNVQIKMPVLLAVKPS